MKIIAEGKRLVEYLFTIFKRFIRISRIRTLHISCALTVYLESKAIMSVESKKYM